MPIYLLHSRWSLWSRNRTRVSWTSKWTLYLWATGAAPATSFYQWRLCKQRGYITHSRPYNHKTKNSKFPHHGHPIHPTTPIPLGFILHAEKVPFMALASFRPQEHIYLKCILRYWGKKRLKDLGCFKASLPSLPHFWPSRHQSFPQAHGKETLLAYSVQNI